MPGVVWPSAQVNDLRTQSALRDIEDQRMQAERDQKEREGMLTKPEAAPSLTPSSWDFSGLKSALMPWDQSAQKEQAPAPSAGMQMKAQTDPWDFSGLRETLTPWAPKPQQPTMPDTKLPSSGMQKRPIPSSGNSGPIDNSSRESFVRTAWPYMLEAAGGNADAAEMMLAAAISENGDVGKGGGFIGNNFYGIKGHGPAGSFNAATWEQENGQRVNQNADFAAYNTPVEGFRGFFDFLQNNSRYAPALERYRQTGDAEQLFRDVNAAGYATNPTWWSDVKSIRDNQVAPVVRRQQQPSAAPQASMHPKVQSAFEAANGRPPTASELEELRSMGLA